MITMMIKMNIVVMVMIMMIGMMLNHIGDDNGHKDDDYDDVDTVWLMDR